MCFCLVCKSLKSSEKPAGVQDSVLWIWRSHEGSLISKAKGPSGVRPASCRVPRAALSPAGADLVCLHHLGLFRVNWVACPVGSCGKEERFSGGGFCKPDCCPRETPSAAGISCAQQLFCSVFLVVGLSESLFGLWQAERGGPPSSG